MAFTREGATVSTEWKVRNSQSCEKERSSRHGESQEMLNFIYLTILCAPLPFEIQSSVLAHGWLSAFLNTYSPE